MKKILKCQQNHLYESLVSMRQDRLDLLAQTPFHFEIIGGKRVKVYDCLRSYPQNYGRRWGAFA